MSPRVMEVTPRMTLARPNIWPCLSLGSLSVFCTGRNFIAQGRGPEWASLGKIGSDRPSAKLCTTPNHSFRKLSVDYYKFLPNRSQAPRIRISCTYLTVHSTQAVVPVTLHSTKYHHNSTTTRKTPPSGVHCKRSATTLAISNKLGLHHLPPGPSQQPKSSRAD